MSLSEVDAAHIRDWLDQDDNRRQYVPVSHTSEQALNAVAAAVSSFVGQFKEVVEPYTQPTVIQIACHHRRAAIVIQSGWLPHNTTPWEVVGVDMTPEQCSDALTASYQANWGRASKAFISSISKKVIDREATEVYHDALVAHEQKLYRAVPRLLFPEIERISREHHVDGKSKTDVSKILSEKLEKMTVSDLHEHGGYDIYGISKLCDHLYHQMWENKPYPEAHTDPVPNRHAAIHGFVSYNSVKSSFDMLVMSELIFAIASALNARSHAS